MKITVLLLMLCLPLFSGCQGRESTTAMKPVTSVAVADEAKGKESLLALLKALQKGDKQAAYVVANLTPEQVDESRKKLINQRVNKLTKEQLASAEHVLQVSGSVDMALKMLKPLLLPTAKIEVVKTIVGTPRFPKALLHEVKVSYTDKKEAVYDKTGRRVKEYLLRFVQNQYTADGRLLQEFMIDEKDFENMLRKTLDVKAYF